MRNLRYLVYFPISIFGPVSAGEWATTQALTKGLGPSFQTFKSLRRKNKVKNGAKEGAKLF